MSHSLLRLMCLLLPLEGRSSNCHAANCRAVSLYGRYDHGRHAGSFWVRLSFQKPIESSRPRFPNSSARSLLTNSPRYIERPLAKPTSAVNAALTPSRTIVAR